MERGRKLFQILSGGLPRNVRTIRENRGKLVRNFKSAEIGLDRIKDVFVLKGDLLDVWELKVLNLDERWMDELDDGFGYLNGLRKLNIRDSKLKRLPDSFGNLSGLQRLDLWGNKLKSLPLRLTRDRLAKNKFYFALED